MEPASVERAGFIENVRNVAAEDDWICVGDTLLREISCCISIIYSDRYLKSPKKVAAVILQSKYSEGTKTDQEGRSQHDLGTVYQSRQHVVFRCIVLQATVYSVFI